VRLTASRLSIWAGSAVLTGLRVLVCVLVPTLGGCGLLWGKSGGTYPNLRDMPSLPPNTTSDQERQRILKDLEQEGQTGSSQATPPAPTKRPAVPPGSSSSAAGINLNECASDAQVVQGLPALRGTLHNAWRPAVAAPPTTVASPRPAKSQVQTIANPPTGEGITGAISTSRPGLLIISFAPGASELNANDRGILYNAAAEFILNGGDRVTIRARGGKAETGAPSHAQPLESLSLGMRRASTIADVLVADGISADHIRIAAMGDQEPPSFRASDWAAARTDGAIVTFAEPKPVE